MQKANETVHEILIRITNEGDSHSRFTRTTSPTDPVNVRLDRIRHLIVDDQRDVRNIDTTTCEIRSDEYIVLSSSDRIECGFSLFLILARMESRRIPLLESERGQ